MFFSGDTINNANPFSPPPPLPSFFNYYQQHSQDLTTAGHDLVPAAISVPPALESNTCFIQQDNQMMNGNLNSDPFLINLLPARKLIKKPAADHLNKDRHRKIVTAQGPRDRRVRLSVQIARKFFDLQDALGFDKASKTLDWLLTKSKSAIDELVNIKPLISSTTADREEVAETGDTTHLKRNKPLMGSTKEKKITRQQLKQNYTFPDFARESRAKARERARERTKEKMWTRKLNESKKLLPDFVLPIQPNHSTTWNQMSSHNIGMVPYFNVDTDQFSQTIAESFFIKRELKQSQNFSTNYQQNLSDSKHVSSNFPHVTENWAISNTFTQVNPSTADFQTYSKLREIYDYKIMSQD